MTPLSNRTVWLAVSAMFILNGALLGIWASRIPAMAERHNLNERELGLLLLLLAVGAIAAFPLAGRFSDRWGAVYLTLRLAVAYTGALGLTALAPNVATLAIALALFGATHGAMDVAMNTWAGEAESHIARPVMSSFHAMFSLGAGLGAASGFVAEASDVGVTPHFIGAGVAIAVLTLPFARIGWVSQTQTSAAGAPLFALPRGPLAAVGLIALCTSVGEGAMLDWSALLLIETSGVTPANAALGYSVFAVAMVVTRLLGDQATRLFGPSATARGAGIFATAGALTAVASPDYAITLVGFALMGIGYAVIMPLAFSRAARDPHLSPGTAIAAVSSLGYGGLLLGPPVIGFVAHATTLRTGFAVLAVLAALIIVLGGSVQTKRV